MWERIRVIIAFFASLSVVIGCNRVEVAKTGSNKERALGVPSDSVGEDTKREFDQENRRNPADAEACAARASAWLNKGNYSQALNDYDQAIRLEPKNAQFWTSRGFTWHMKGIDDKERAKCEERALSDYAEAIRLDPRDAQAINNRAWILATCKVTRFRNGKQAIENATRACELTSWKNAGFLDTLSVAYAEAGNFEQAIEWQRKALQDPTYEREDGEIAREKLALFKQKKPFRE
jgi:Tfp pilus assembly protein PilF